MAFTTASVVRNLAQVTYTDFKTGTFADNDALDAFLTSTIIPDAEDIVQDYCRTTWTDSTAPDGVKVATKQVASNMLHIMILNKQGPTVNVGDYKVEFADRNPLSDAVKDLLAKHVAQGKYVKVTESQTDEYEDQWG